MSKIDQIYLKAVMLCMSKTSKLGKEHQILCILKHVEDVKDRSNTPKGCNAMYVEDVEDGKRTYTHTFMLITSLISNRFSIRKKFWKAET